MQKRIWISFAALVCMVLAGVVGWAAAMTYGSGSGRLHARALPVLGKAPSYAHLTNQVGQTVSSAQFGGKVRIVTFLFPYCRTYCPLIAAHLAGFEHTLADSGLQDRVQIVAFDVDPAGTGPKQMRAFLQEYGWQPDDLRWQYLTGTPKQIRRIVTDGYHIDYQQVTDDDSPQGRQQTLQPPVVNRLADKADVNYDISHNDGLVIVDAQGRIRKIYDQADMVSQQQLLNTIRPLIQHPAGAD